MGRAVELGFSFESLAFVCIGYSFLSDTSQDHNEERIAGGGEIVDSRFSYKPFTSIIGIPISEVGSFLVRSDGRSVLINLASRDWLIPFSILGIEREAI